LSLVVALLAFAGAAAGDTTTSTDALVVGTEQAPDISLVELVSVTGGVVGNLELDVPAGYTLDPAQPGTKLADLIVITRAGDIALGALTDVDPGSYTDPAVLACDTQPHAAVWSMTVESTSINVPWFVDAGANGGYTVHVCLPAAQFGGGSGSLQVGALLAEFDGTLHSPTAPGSYLWHALVTPFGSDGQTIDATKLVEFQSVVPLPVTFTMKAAYNAKTKVATVSGQLLLSGQPATGYTLDIGSAKTLDGAVTQAGTAQVEANGSYNFPVRVAQSEYVIADPEPAQSTCTSATGAACVSTELPLAEATAHVTVPKPVKKKLPPKCKKGQKSTKKHPCPK
jgi:hypothetical protein